MALTTWLHDPTHVFVSSLCGRLPCGHRLYAGRDVVLPLPRHTAWSTPGVNNGDPRALVWNSVLYGVDLCEGAYTGAWGCFPGYNRDASPTLQLSFETNHKQASVSDHSPASSQWPGTLLGGQRRPRTTSNYTAKVLPGRTRYVHHTQLRSAVCGSGLSTWGTSKNQGPKSPCPGAGF